MKKLGSKFNTISRLILIAIFAMAISACQKSAMNPLSSDSENSIAVSQKTIPAPDVPEIIEVPAGNHAIWHAYATGDQIYQVTESLIVPGTYVWTFIAPSATLYSDAAYNFEVGTHYVGPTWEATTGPKTGKYVVGTKLQSITEDVTAIPWLLLQANASADPDYYSQVTYIQRINTTGGLAPATGADAEHLGDEAYVHYTAEYYFYAAD
jgi:hypothetical protein